MYLSEICLKTVIDFMYLFIYGINVLLTIFSKSTKIQQEEWCMPLIPSTYY